MDESNDQASKTHVNDALQCASAMPATIDQSRTNEAGAAPHESTDESSNLDFLSPPQDAEEIGRLGNYRILGKLGSGGMGVVLLGDDLKLRRLAALKVMKPGLAENPKTRDRFLREAQAAARVHHDNIMPILHIDDEHETPFFAMPYLAGETLANLLGREPKFPISEAIRIGRETALGLAAAHEHGLIHRDIKPGNIWIEGAERRVRILDFGLARHSFATTTLTSSGQLIGTPAYMAPEQANNAPVDHRCDLFSLGVLIYRMCTGTQPFLGADLMGTLHNLANKQVPPISELNPAAPGSLSDLVQALMERDPDHRPATAADVADRLKDIQDGATVSKPISFQPRAFGKIAIAVVVLTALLIAAVELVVGMKRWHGTVAKDAVADKVEVVNPILNHANVAAAPPPAWFDLVRKLPPKEQVTEVVAELLRRNPEFRGKHDYEIVDGKVDRLTLDGKLLEDVSPIAALRELRQLIIPGTLGKPDRLRTIEPLRGLKLQKLNLAFQDMVADLSPLAGMPLKDLSLFQTTVSDLTPLRGAPLTSLWCNWTNVVSLEPLRGMPLESLVADHTYIADLTPLRGAPLKSIMVGDTKVTDLSPLVDAPLREIFCDFDKRRDGPVLKKIKTLQTINAKPAAASLGTDVRKKGAFEPLDPLWASRLQKVPPGEQIEMVKHELKRRNPDFKENLTHQVKNGVVVGVFFNTTGLVDLTPVAALGGLRHLRATGRGQTMLGDLVDLSPLSGLQLEILVVAFNRIQDIKPLANMKVRSADLGWNPIKSLAGLNVERLESLGLCGTKVNDISQLAKARLKELELTWTGVTTLEPLRGQPLESLYIRFCGVDDFEPVASAKLKRLECSSRSGLARRALTTWPGLEVLQKRPAAEYRRLLDRAEQLFGTPADVEWIKKVQLLPAEKQLKEVDAQLVIRNPDLNLGDVKGLVADGRVVEISIPTVEVGDIAPVAALKHLEVIHCLGRSDIRGRLTDISPLKGLPLKRVDLGWNPIRDLNPLRGMKLEWLSLFSTDVDDLTPLAGMPLRCLILHTTRVQRIGPLRDCPLDDLSLPMTNIADPGVLAKLPLVRLGIQYRSEVHRKILESIPTLKYINGRPAKTVLEGR